MQIYGPFRVSTNQSVSPNNRVQTAPNSKVAENASRSPVDQLDLSSSVSDVNRLQNTSEVTANGEIRVDRVAELRRQIANGTYETPEKIDAALDRILDQFA